MMSSLGSLAVDELLTRPVTISPTEPVTRAIGLLQRAEAYEVFVVKNGRVMGIVTIRDLLKAGDIATTKISSMATRLPLLNRNDSVSLAARIMTDYRVRAVPVVESDDLVGQLTAQAVCDRLSRLGRLNLRVAGIMTSNLLILQEGDLIAKARNIMIRRDIDHLPVVRERHIAGIVTSDAIVYRMSPPEKITRESLVAEKQKRLDVKVSALMETDPVTSAPDADVSEVLREMKSRKATYSLVAVWGELQGIITYRDCVKLLAEPVKEALPVSMVGLPDDPFEAEVAKTKFERVVKRLAKSLPELLEARSVIKTSSRAGRRRRYEVEVTLITPTKRTSFTESGWSLPAIYDVLSERMKQLTTKKPKPGRHQL